MAFSAAWRITEKNSISSGFHATSLWLLIFLLEVLLPKRLYMCVSYLSLFLSWVSWQLSELGFCNFSVTPIQTRLSWSSAVLAQCGYICSYCVNRNDLCQHGILSVRLTGPFSFFSLSFISISIFHTYVAQSSYFKPCSSFSFSWVCWSPDSNQAKILRRGSPKLQNLEQHILREKVM